MTGLKNKGVVRPAGAFKFIRKIRNISIGWAKRFKLIKTTNSERIVVNLRMAKCGVCEFAKKSKILEILNGDVHHTNTLLCTKCGCPCLEKALVMDESCPINKW